MADNNGPARGDREDENMQLLLTLNASDIMQSEAKDEDKGEDSRQVGMIKVAAADFSPADKTLLDSGKYSDAKVMANGKTYDVHKSVICTRSKWFATALDSGFREGNSSTVEISAPDNIDRLLEFLYTGTVKISIGNDTMAAANELSVLGDFYQVKELKEYAEQVLGQYLGEHLLAIATPENGLLCGALPPQYSEPSTLPPDDDDDDDDDDDWGSSGHNFRVVKHAGFVDRLCAAIREAYNTPSGIHDVYVNFVCAARCRTFRCELVRDLRDEVPEFGADLLTAMMHGLSCPAFRGNKTFERWKDTFALKVKEPECSRCAYDGA